MERIYFGNGRRWFDLDAAELVAAEGRRWDGNNMVGVISGLQTDIAGLYRTASGEWVENVNATREHNGPNHWGLLTPTEAKAWVIRSEAENTDAILERFFSKTPDEPADDLPGGVEIPVKFAEDVLELIAIAAEKSGQSRAEWIRRTVAAAL
ncbi:hypothetical protein ACFCZR_24950 [Streptomyces rubiginosohelvolus]|uniref:hypothetical protein n=1 Tax=Streptomyces rubiginosohelvolus TaxID=67362 RepID=UPI0035D7F50B